MDFSLILKIAITTISVVVITYTCRGQIFPNAHTFTNCIICYQKLSITFDIKINVVEVS